MDKKKLWIIGGIIAAMIPIIVVLCLYTFVWKNEKPTTQTESQPPVSSEPVPTVNGGTITPVDDTAVNVELDADGTSVSDALFEYKSPNGFSLQYNNKYIVDLENGQYDFFIKNDDASVSVAISTMDMEEDLAAIQTKEEWDAFMMPAMGTESIAFNRTVLNGMDVLVSNYSLVNENKEVGGDVLMAMFLGKEKIYSYFYVASSDADEIEKQQIGAIIYTITEQ